MFILGMGFVGQFFAKNLKNEDWVVNGTCTSSTKLKKLEESGFDVCQFYANEAELDIVSTVKSYTHLLVSIPPVAGVGDPMLQHRELLRSMLMGGNLQWLGYLSSTSVYGHSGGAWVDEDYPASPTSEAGKLRLVAEEGWLNLGRDLGLSTQVFRLGGIYGPRRSHEGVTTYLSIRRGATVSELKEAIEEKRGVEKTAQVLYIIVLEDENQSMLLLEDENRSLSEYGIEDDSLIHLVAMFSIRVQDSESTNEHIIRVHKFLTVGNLKTIIEGVGVEVAGRSLFLLDEGRNNPLLDNLPLYICGVTSNSHIIVE